MDNPESPISIKEIELFVNNLLIEKIPGLDGVIHASYRAFKGGTIWILCELFF